MITRFAPSPTGHLHIGHAWSAFFGSQMAKAAQGRFILRIEDIDQGRCRPEFIDDILTDIDWLGLSYETPVRQQSAHFVDFQRALDRLKAMGILYPCFCARRDIQDEIERSGAAPHGPEGALYPGTCRHLGASECDEKIAAGLPYALRLDLIKALKHAPSKLIWVDFYRGEQVTSPEVLINTVGDVVLARKGIPASYHLCVVLDDHIQGITHVTRGDDLLYASPLHRLLQHLLNLSAPIWAHHPLLLDAEGKRFAKRNKSATLKSIRETGASVADIEQIIWDSLPVHGPWRRLLMDAP